MEHTNFGPEGTDDARPAPRAQRPDHSVGGEVARVVGDLSSGLLENICARAPGMVFQFLMRPDGSVSFPFVSEGCREICEVDPQDVQMDANVVLNLIHPEDRSSFDASVLRSAATLAPWIWEGRGVCSGDRIKWVQTASRPARRENGEIVWDGLLLDVTVRKEAEVQQMQHRRLLEETNARLRDLNQNLEALASLDGLTGLSNRRAFQARLDEELSRVARFHTPLSLLMLDVDHFKHFNDEFGHLNGDEVLKIVSRILRENVREIDMAARYGGEEFAVILPNTDNGAATAMAERLRHLIQDEDWERRPVTVSNGVATEFCVLANSQLISRADAALYQSKQTGRNRVSSAH